MIAKGIILALLTLILDLYTDLRLFYRERSVKHFRGFLLRCIGGIPALCLISWGKEWYIWAIAAGMLFFWYLTLFDGLYGSLRREGFWYVGKGKDAAFTDRIQTNWPVWLRATVKITGIILFTTLYLWLK